MRSWPVLLVLALVAAPAVTSGCGTDAQHVDECKKVEEARCKAAPGCPSIQLTPPEYTSGSAVDACIRFYDIACLHGLDVNGVSGTDVDNCVKAITNACGDGGACKGDDSTGCAIIETPWVTHECAWLTPPNTPPPDASPDAAETSSAPDGGTDLGDAKVTFPDGF